MERLTKKGFNFTTNFIKRDIDSWSIAQCLKKLQEYEDAEEQGLLLRLPCKVGDTVYCIRTLMDFENAKIQREVIVEKFRLEMLCDIGYAYFLTKEEAEQKLKEMESDSIPCSLKDEVSKKTNADSIRTMSDEELAMNMMCPNESGLGEIECDKSDNCNCYKCLLKWLQSEVK